MGLAGVIEFSRRHVDRRKLGRDAPLDESDFVETARKIRAEIEKVVKARAG
jgi:hypothetical protein